MGRILTLTLTSLLVILAGCVSGPREVDAEYREADWIIGSWRIDSYLKAGTHSRDVLLRLTFLPNGFVDVVDEGGSSNLAQRCRWRPRLGRVHTSCGGVDLRIRDRSSGPAEVELGGSVRVPYYVEECGRWTVDSLGNRVCAYYHQVERFRSISARGEGILEPAI